jgi:hypothetical protein
MFCPKCGARSEYGKFCRACGTNLAAVSEVIDEDPPQEIGAAAAGGGGMTLGLFSSAGISNETRDIAGHRAAAVFGNVTVELTGASLPAGETRISAYTLFGQVDIVVPDGVAVRITGISAFSGVSVRGEPVGNGFFHVDDYVSAEYQQAPRRLHIEIASFFSGLKIKR